MPPRLDRHLDRVVHVDRPDGLTVNLDVIRATTHLHPEGDGITSITGFQASVLPRFGLPRILPKTN